MAKSFGGEIALPIAMFAGGNFAQQCPVLSVQAKQFRICLGLASSPDGLFKPRERRLDQLLS